MLSNKMLIVLFLLVFSCPASAQSVLADQHGNIIGNFIISGSLNLTTTTTTLPLNGVYLSAANTLQITTSGANALTLSTSGNATFKGTVTDGTAQLVNAATGGIIKTNGSVALTTTGGTGSGAEQTINYQPGLLTAVTSVKSVFSKFVKSSTVDNVEGSAYLFSCVSNPTITLFECGTDVNCATSPTTIGTVTVTAAGVAVDGTVSNAAITAGDYVAWALTAGTCTSLDISANSQLHAN